MARETSRYVRTSTRGVFRRGKNFYAPHTENGKKVWGQAYNTEKQAALARVERQHRQEVSADGDETVDSYAERWCVSEHTRPSDSTNQHNYERVKGFAEHFKGRTFRDLTRQEVRQWANKRVKGKHLNRGRVPAVRAMYSDAIADGYATENPLTGMRLGTAKRKDRILILTESELVALDRAAEAVWGDYGKYLVGPMILCAAYTGLRPGELFALRPMDVDNERSVIHVERQWSTKLKRYTLPKNGTIRDVLLLPEAANALKRVLRPANGSEVLFKTIRGRPYIQRVHYYYWNPVRAHFWAKLPEHRQEVIERSFDFYELRHFFGSYLAHELETMPYDIADQMGHTDGGKVAMDRYVTTDSEQARARILAKAHERTSRRPVAHPVAKTAS